MGVARLVTLLLLLGTATADVVESKTSLKFPEKRGGAALSKLGVRYKGPIKVYAVGEYSDKSYMLKMSYGVNAQKISSALGEALKPRCSDTKSIEAFENCLKKGLPNGAPKGTKMVFSTAGGKLGVSVNDKQVGTIASKAIATAFANIYSDSKAVCTMNAVGSDGEVAAGGGGLLTPMRGAVAGALLGYKLGKLLE